MTKIINGDEIESVKIIEGVTLEINLTMNRLVAEHGKDAKAIEAATQSADGEFSGVRYNSFDAYTLRFAEFHHTDTIRAESKNELTLKALHEALWIEHGLSADAPDVGNARTAKAEWLRRVALTVEAGSPEQLKALLEGK
jgi:hypothetical protein